MQNTSLPACVEAFFHEPSFKTPCLVMELPRVAAKYQRLLAAMPNARHHFAIKANPEPEVLRVLHALGCSFEVASTQEIMMCLKAGAQAVDLLYGNPYKKVSEIKFAFDKGVRQFVYDDLVELEKLAEHAPGCQVFCRITTTGEGAKQPLSGKFGCSAEYAEQSLIRARALGLKPRGISFHTGSQQLDVSAWERPIMETARIFKNLANQGITLEVMDVGGGFPVNYRSEAPGVEAITTAINKYTEEYFDDFPLIYTEPGRYMVADAGHIIAEAVLISDDCPEDEGRWVYLDIGRYGGLVEDVIDYPIISDQTGETGRVIIAGQTCDSNDVVYRQCFDYQLPMSMRSGDRVVLMNTGAYTTTYSTTLNGFDPLRCICVNELQDESGPNQSIYPDEFLRLADIKNLKHTAFPSKDSIELKDCGEVGMAVVALKDFKRGELIGQFTGTLQSEVLQHSLQIEPDLHLHDPYFIGYLMHHCDPNCVLDMHQRKIYCVKDIQAGESLSMDYVTTEDELFKQFPCSCSASNCRGWISGRAQTITEEGQLHLAKSRSARNLVEQRLSEV